MRHFYLHVIDCISVYFVNKSSDGLDRTDGSSKKFPSIFGIIIVYIGPPLSMKLYKHPAIANRTSRIFIM